MTDRDEFPRLPKPDYAVTDGVACTDYWRVESMALYAQAARAPLLAEIERLNQTRGIDAREYQEMVEKASSATIAMRQLLEIYDTHDPKALLEAFAAVRTMFMVSAIRQEAGRHGG